MKQSKDELYMKQILDFIMDGEIVSMGKIAKEVGISEKSVRNKLNDLDDYLRENDFGTIQRKPRVGIWFDSTPQQKEALSSVIDLKGNDLAGKYNPKERVTEILKIFFNLWPWQKITTQKLAEQLYLSVPTVLKVLKECEEWLEQYNIKLVNERGKGYCLKGEESSYRIALKNLIMEKKEREEIQKNLDYFFTNINVSTMEKCIIRAENSWKNHFTDESFYEILIYCCLAYKRKEFGYSLVGTHNKEELELLQKYNEYEFTVAIFKEVEDEFHVRFTEEEVLFLSIQILCSKFIGFSEDRVSLEDVKKYDNKLLEFVDKLLAVIGNILDVDFSGDQQLKESLILHLRPTIFRLRYGTPEKNDLSQFIKLEYKHVFRASWAISILFDEYYNLQITEDEIGYIVLYIQASIERRFTQYKAVFLTKANMGHAQLIKERIRKAIPEITEISFVGTHEFRLMDHKDADIIISQTEMKEKDKRIVVIPNMLSEKGIMTLRNHLNVMGSQIQASQKCFSPGCCLLFSPELIFVEEKVSSKEEILKVMCDAMERKGFVTENFFHTVMERESKTTTSIGNGVSLPHGSPTEVNESKVAIAILKEPIMWDNELVQIIFLLGFKMITKEEINRIQLFYKEYVSLIENQETISRLKEMESSIEIYKYLIH